MNRAVSFMLLSLLLGPRSGMAQDSPAIPQHIVVKVDGSPVTFKRPEWSQFAPMRFGTVLGESDLVNVAPLQLCEKIVHFEAVAVFNSRAGTIFSASASKRGSPRSGSSSGSTLINPISEPARS